MVGGFVLDQMVTKWSRTFLISSAVDVDYHIGPLASISQRSDIAKKRACRPNN